MELKDIPILGFALSWLDDEDVDYGIIAIIVGILIIVVLLEVVGIKQSAMVTYAFALSPVWLPYLTFHIFFDKYMEMVGKKFTIKSGRVIFEVKLPAEVFKSPEAMEMVFTQLYNAATPDNLMETYLDGKRPLDYSIELVSRGGDVHFYMSVPEKNVNALQDNLYAQYPGIELIKQTIDYTAEIPHDLKNISFMSFHFGKKKDAVYPIKTYIDFGMDKLPKEEEKVDPMTPMLEMLAGIKPNQQLWIQFLFKAHRKKEFKHGQLHKEGTWEKNILKEVDKLMGRDEENSENSTFERLTLGERKTIEAMERQAGKYAFECAGRVVYISQKGEGDYDGGLFSRMIRSLAQTEVIGQNGLGIRWRTDFNYKFLSDPFGKRIPALKKEELAEYKKRVLYAKNGAMGNNLFSTEELATLFHIPGSVAMTPTLNRVPSTRGEAPSNLPTGVLPI